MRIQNMVIIMLNIFRLFKHPLMTVTQTKTYEIRLIKEPESIYSTDHNDQHILFKH